MTKSLYCLLAVVVLLTACGGKEPGTDATNALKPALQEAPALISRDSLFGNPERTVARISPDGRHVSWLAPKDGVMNVWVAKADNPGDARAITNDTYRGIRSYSWAPNSKYVYFQQDQGGDENFHVYASNVETAAVRDLTPVAEGARATIEQLSSSRPNHIVVGINERDPQVFDLYLVDVTSGERQLLKENPGYAGWLIDNVLEPRFGFLPTPDGGGRVVDFDGEEFAVIPPEDFLATQAIGFNKDNTAVFMLDSRDRDTAALTRVSVATGERVVLAENANADISGILTDQTTLEPVAYNVDYLKSSWQGLTDTARADLKIIEGKLKGSTEHRLHDG